MMRIQIEISSGAKASPRPTGHSSQESLENHHNEEKQMMGSALLNTGAASTSISDWKSIDWIKIEKQVRRLQMRIAKATQEGRYGKAKALQWLLTHSLNAKILAVKRVTSNRGAKTSGVDDVLWTTGEAKLDAAFNIKRHGYRAKPLRRVYIAKSNGKRRPLGIPTMMDRAQQALHLQALEPITETTSDKNSYGFRPYRSCADAVEQCFNVLARRSSATWVLEADIKGCFDNISHEWLFEHVPMDQKLLRQWLKCGYLEKQILYETADGTPQGGIISPVLANCALNGLEELVRRLSTRQLNKINMIRYADDFIVTGKSKEQLENIIKPAIESFLATRGLQLSLEKTKITHIDNGFDFLGFNIRKYNGKLLIKPAKKNVLAFIENSRSIIRTAIAWNTESLIKLLNARVRGWSYYYRHGVAKRTFNYIDSEIFRSLKSWCRRRHSNKSRTWIRKKYFRSEGMRNWIFTTTTINKKGESRYLDLFRASDVKIIRHIKIKADFNPYAPEWDSYIQKRLECKRTTRLVSRLAGPIKK